MEDVSRFAELLATPNPRLDLALALIAAAGRPEVDPDELVAELDELSSAVAAADAEGICRELFSPNGPIGRPRRWSSPPTRRARPPSSPRSTRPEA
ncbi:MAG: hypothetical protein ACK4V6_11825 [Microthrixaceae bacterium]